MVAFTLAFTMCEYSLTSNPAESDMPTEAEPWQPVDVSEVKEKMQKLSTTPVEPKVEAAPSSPPAPQEEVDFGSEPEELLLKGPLVSTASALPTSTPSVQDSTSAAASASTEAFTRRVKRLYLGYSICFCGSFTRKVQPTA